MTNGPSRQARVSRESRLLLLTVAVCVAVLLLLARMRFPEAPLAVDTAALPLERLAGRASYDALAADVQRVEPMIGPNLLVLRVAPRVPAGPLDIRDVLARPDSPSGARHVVALRIGADSALAALDADARVEGIVGGSGGGVEVVAADPVRRIARLRVPEAAVRQIPQLPLASLPTPVYVVVVEGTQAGATLRPAFLGRGDRFGSVRWAQPLLPLGGIAVAPGALLFSLAGEFIGTVVVENGATAIAGAGDVLDVVERLGSSSLPPPLDLGLTVQALTPALSAALGAGRGVVVSEVHPGGAASALEAGDVITAVDGWSTDDPDELLLRLASRQAGDAPAVAIVRNGEAATVTLPLAAAAREALPDVPLALASERGIGTRVEPGEGPSATGLLPGDVITRAGATAAPTPAQVRQLLATSTASGWTTLVVRRGGRQHVVAVPVAPRSDAPAR